MDVVIGVYLEVVVFIVGGDISLGVKLGELLYILKLDIDGEWLMFGVVVMCVKCFVLFFFLLLVLFFLFFDMNVLNLLSKLFESLFMLGLDI